LISLLLLYTPETAAGLTVFHVFSHLRSVVGVDRCLGQFPEYIASPYRITNKVPALFQIQHDAGIKEIVFRITEAAMFSISITPALS